MATYDVAIIGAGLSGLSAARSIHNSHKNLTYTVLEARSRVGGKTFSHLRSDGKGVQELGAAWINDSNQSHMWALAQKFGLHPVVQDTEGYCAFQDGEGGEVERHEFLYGDLPKFSEEERENCVRVRDLVNTASLEPSNFAPGPRRSYLDSISLEAFLKAEGAGERALTTASIWSRGMLGVDAQDVSALYFLEYCRAGLGIVNMRSDCKHGPQYLRLEEGTQSFSVNMAALLNPGSVKLDTPVTAISQLEENLIALTLSNGSLVHARRVILSIPSPTYKNITFSPPLPPARAGFVASASYGYYVKFIATFKKPFWRENGQCGLAQSFRGPVAIFRDTSVHKTKNFALTAFITGSPGRKWGELPGKKEREVAVLKQIAEIFAVPEELVEGEFIESLVSPWMDDPWAGYGCPCASTAPGVLEKAGGIEEMVKAFLGVYFVGTELASEWRGYMEGAVRSGQRGAEEVTASLQIPAAKL